MFKYHDEDYINFLQTISPALVRPRCLPKSLKHDMANFCLSVDARKGDNPVFDGLFRFSALSAGGSLVGAQKLVSKEADIAINWAGSVFSSCVLVGKMLM